MKKIFFSLLAVAAIASCAKTEPVYLEDNSEIKLAPVTSMVTKAQPGAIDGTQYPAAENFDVYAYWAEEGAGSVFTTGYTEYLGTPQTGYGVEFTKKGDWYWGGTTPYYWPKNGSLRFAAYSPADLQHKVMHNLASDTYTVDGYTQPSTTDATFDFLLAPTSVSYTAATAVDDVDVVFEHALSWITLQAKAADKTASGAFTIHNVQIDQVNTVADLEAAMPAKVWSNWGTPEDYVVNDAYNEAITEEVAVLDKVENGTVIIPQATTTVTIEYTQNAVNGSAVLPDQKVTVPLTLDEDNTPWEPGKHYIYTIIFSLDEILITPSVVDWEDVTVADKNFDEFPLTDVVVAAGETYVVPTDAMADTKVTVAGTFDGDGHTVSAAELDEVVGGTLPIFYLNADGAAVKNVTIDGKQATCTVNGTTYGVRNIVVAAAGTYTIENVTSINATYPLYVAASDVVLNVKNSTLEGWTSYGAGTTGNFENVEFTAGTYDRFRPYGTTVLKNCSFEKDFVIDLSRLAAGETVTFEGCTYNGAALAEANISTVDDTYTMAGTFSIN